MIDVQNYIKENFFDRRFVSGVFCGSCVELWIWLEDIDPYFRYEAYASVLTLFGLYMLSSWWYPIWVREKEVEKRNKELMGV